MQESAIVRQETRPPGQVILISGKQGSGKTSLASALERVWGGGGPSGGGVAVCKFADPIYALHNRIYDTLEEWGIIEPGPRRKDGKLLQLLGTEWGRSTFGADVWTRFTRRRCSTLVESGRTVIVDDLRFKDELSAFPEAFKIRLECPRDIRRTRCTSWREDDTHVSEIDLDDSLDLFDIVVPTDLVTLDRAVEIISAAVASRISP